MITKQQKIKQLKKEIRKITRIINNNLKSIRLETELLKEKKDRRVKNWIKKLIKEYKYANKQYLKEKDIFEAILEDYKNEN